MMTLNLHRFYSDDITYRSIRQRTARFEPQSHREHREEFKKEAIDVSSKNRPKSKGRFLIFLCVLCDSVVQIFAHPR